jgi:hypothetical protein
MKVGMHQVNQCYYCMSSIEDLHVTSPMVAAILEVFFSCRVGHFNGNNVRKRPKIGQMHQIKPELRRQDLEGIHLP